VTSVAAVGGLPEVLIALVAVVLLIVLAGRLR
jgi:hypothetical protein